MINMNRKIQKTGSVQKSIGLGAMILISAMATFAADPEPVRLIEKLLTTEEAQSAQKAWAEHIGFEVASENSLGMKLRVIPPGTYRMSSRRVEEGDKGGVK